MRKLAIITTHPIQYNAPLFRLLSQRGQIEIKVFYTWSQAQDVIYDPDFGVSRSWDIPLLEGYPFEFVKNISKNPGSHAFWGINNPGLISKIEIYHPDGILIFGWSFISHLRAIVHFSNKIPIFFRGDSTLLNEPNGFSTKKILRRVFLKWVYRHIKIAYYTGIENKKYYEKYGLSKNQLVFAGHAIENERFFQQNEADKNVIQLRIQLKCEIDDIIILFAGKFQDQKNPEFLIDSFLSTNRKNIRLVLAGEGQLKSKLKDMSKNDKRIHFLPFQNQSHMPALYKLCDVFVLPSKSETWGLSINEAMASGKAVIVSDRVGCANDLIIPNENGFVFKSGNNNQLSEIFNTLDKKVLLKMGIQNKIRILNWNYEDICKSIERDINN